MRKRLRKKKHYGEFTEWGRQFVITLSREDGYDDFLDVFIVEAIEANGCLCFAVGCEYGLDAIVELGCCVNDLDTRTQRIAAWLDGRSDVQSYRIGELFDTWHGHCKDLEERAEQANPPDVDKPLR